MGPAVVSIPHSAGAIASLCAWSVALLLRELLGEVFEAACRDRKRVEGVQGRYIANRAKLCFQFRRHCAVECAQ